MAGSRRLFESLAFANKNSSTCAHSPHHLDFPEAHSLQRRAATAAMASSPAGKATSHGSPARCSLSPQLGHLRPSPAKRCLLPRGSQAGVDLRPHTVATGATLAAVPVSAVLRSTSHSAYNGNGNGKVPSPMPSYGGSSSSSSSNGVVPKLQAATTPPMPSHDATSTPTRTCLQRVRIKDFALVSDQAITFGPLLNAITGESGSGKSVLVGAYCVCVCVCVLQYGGVWQQSVDSRCSWVHMHIWYLCVCVCARA